MTVGKLLMTICAVCIALGIAYFGYVLFLGQRVSQYQAVLNDADFSPRTAQAYYDALKGAPSMRCAFESSSFSAARAGTLYIASGKIRVDISEVTGDTRGVHYMIDDSGMYVWEDSGTAVYQFSLETSRDVQTLGVHAKASCESWAANDRAFVLPGRPIESMGV